MKQLRAEGIRLRITGCLSQTFQAKRESRDDRELVSLLEDAESALTRARYRVVELLEERASA